MRKVKQRDDWEIHVLFKLFSFYICRISIKNCMVILKNNFFWKLYKDRKTGKSIFINKEKHLNRVQQ